MLKITLIEDNYDYRNALKTEIDFQHDMQCVHDFGSVSSALSAKGRFKPDVLITDLGLPGVDGLDAIPEFKQLWPGTQIMVLTISEDRARVMQALAHGANGYLLKTDPLERVIAGIRNIASGEAPMSAAIAEIVLRAFREKMPVVSTYSSLTRREAEVLQLLAEGSSRKFVADALNLSTHTINNHVRNVYEKLEVHNLSGALRKAWGNGLF